MVRVLGATGRMYEAAAVVPVVEHRMIANGSIECKLEVVVNLDENPNGLLFLSRAEDVGTGNIYEGDVIEYIGNIFPEDISEILSFMLVDGYYNFSEWNFQMGKNMKDIKLDNGLSNPYSSAITNILDFEIISGPIGKNVFSGDWSFIENADNGYVGNGNEISVCQSDSNHSIYDEEWNTEEVLDEDGWDDGEEGWDAWDYED